MTLVINSYYGRSNNDNNENNVSHLSLIAGLETTHLLGLVLIYF